MAGDPKRRLFSSRRSASPSLGDPRLEAVIATAHQAIAERFEESLRVIADNALATMRQVADDVWHATGTEVKDLKERILRDLSREQAIRGLIAHSDDRFQALDVRVARIEEGMWRVDQAATAIKEALTAGNLEGLREALRGTEGLDAQEIRALREQVERSLEGQSEFAVRVRDWLQAAATAQTGFARELAQRVETAIAAQGGATPGTEPNGLDTVRDRLTAMQEYLGSVVQYLGERDRALIDWLQTLARNQAGEMRTEVERVLQAIEQRLETRAEQADFSVRDAIALHAQSVHDQIEQQARIVAESLGVLETKAIARIEEQSRHVESLAEQLRTETEDVKRLILEQAGTAEITHELDERLGRLMEMMSSALGWTVDRLEEAIGREVLRSVEVGMADLVAMLDRRFVDLERSIGDRVEQMDRAMRAGLGALEESLVERSGEAIDEILASRLVPTTAELTSAAVGIRESAKSLELIQQTLEASMARVLDDRVAALARMVRSDHQALAERLEVVEQQAAAKEAIRAVNELAAAIPAEIGDALDKRLAMVAEVFRRENRSTADVVVKVGGALADRMDRSVAKIGDRFDREVETVVDQLGDTMATVATGLQRTTAGRNRAS
ncbi:MAG: hypothetical protein M3Q23_15835 [Actinomycetota bacterium]|nr:hypothetical protein [Actinomycetota bacterium]